MSEVQKQVIVLCAGIIAVCTPSILICLVTIANRLVHLTGLARKWTKAYYD